VALAYERMINSPRIKDLLIRSHIADIQNNTNDSRDFTSIDESIAKLLDQGRISEEVVFSLHETLNTW
jgi:Tfp pilus assembly ATPase PilU